MGKRCCKKVFGGGEKMDKAIEKSVNQCIQELFINHCQPGLDSPISRNEFDEAGWTSYAYITYYRFFEGALFCIHELSSATSSVF